jgi:hypothetical protein
MLLHLSTGATVIQENNSSLTPKRNTLSYMLFAFGAIVIIFGVYLSTYSTVVMVDRSYSIPYMVSYQVPLPTQIYPYQSIGAFSILSALALIGVATYQVISKQNNLIFN